MIRFVLYFVLLGANVFAGEITPAIKELSPTTFQIGEVTLDKAARTATFAASINMREGLVEYLLVNETGKAHESLLVTKALPSHLHIAMLLLGAKAGKQSGTPPGQIDAQYLQSAPELTGENVDIAISWIAADGIKHQCAAEELIANTDQKEPLERGPWCYSGSAVVKGTFLAQAEGSMIALVTDPAALISNPRPGHQNDMVWTIRPDKVPPVRTSVKVTLTLELKK